MQILYFKYQPNERLYAHVLEHCLHDVLKEFYKAEILSAKTGLGYSNISFKQASKIKDLENFFDKINKRLFIKHKKLVLSEIWNKRRNYFVLTELIENGCSSKNDLNKIKKDFYSISYKTFLSFCKKRFVLMLVKNLEDIQNININVETKSLSKPEMNFNFPKKQVKNIFILEYGWFVPVKNVAEAIVLSWFYEEFLNYINKEIYNKSIAYEAEGILYKPSGPYFLINISLISDKIVPIKLLPELEIKQFLKKRQELVRDLKKNKIFGLEDAFYQKMDWGNCMSDKEIISYIQKTPYSKWKKMFSEESIEHKIIAIVDQF